MAYKKLIKVSNVCQVLDKSKYLATRTENGITFTNNGDGSYTANGTFASSDMAYFYFIDNITLLANHKYLVLNGTYYEVGKYSVWLVVVPNLVAESNCILFGNDYAAKTYTPKKNEKNVTLSMHIKGNINTEIDNFVFKPQLFDLTEMYGAGHEPTSVEQFRQDFPEEMYDYSPYCWLTSYKRVIMTGEGNYLTSYQRNLTCKTKNLFDINSYNNINNFSNITINGNSILCVARAANAHVLYSVPTVIGEKYTVSNKSFVRGGLVSTGNFGLFLSDNPSIDSSNYLVSGLQSGQSFTITATSEFLYIHWYVCYNFDSNNPSTIEINELQVNLGDTATDYVPYGHL